MFPDFMSNAGECCWMWDQVRNRSETRVAARSSAACERYITRAGMIDSTYHHRIGSYPIIKCLCPGHPAQFTPISHLVFVASVFSRKESLGWASVLKSKESASRASDLLFQGWDTMCECLSSTEDFFPAWSDDYLTCIFGSLNESVLSLQLLADSYWKVTLIVKVKMEFCQPSKTSFEIFIWTPHQKDGSVLRGEKCDHASIPGLKVPLGLTGTTFWMEETNDGLLPSVEFFTQHSVPSL